LGLASGSTPIGTYQDLSLWNRRGDFSFREVRTVNLDEYQGLPADHDQSYRCFMRTNFFDHIDIYPENTYMPDGMAADPATECARYDALIRALGWADLQLLGLGRIGHIGFNEPSDCFVKETHVVDLTQSTIDANARFFASRDDVPRQALTMGIGCIMAARRVLLIASGEDKADAVYNAFCGPITPQCPASILQLHNDVVLVGDKAALSRLTAAGVPVCG
jgi:glucosamine-6-phosphate deaminase